VYKDIITYELAENSSEQQLISIAKQIVKWEIHTNNDGSYTDIVFWKSKEDAKIAEKEMVNIPNASEWYACYKEGTITSKKFDYYC